MCHKHGIYGRKNHPKKVVGIAVYCIIPAKVGKRLHHLLLAKNPNLFPRFFYHTRIDHMKIKNTIAKILAVLSLAAFAHFSVAAETGPERDRFHVGIGPAYVILQDRCDGWNEPGDTCEDSEIGLKAFANYRAHKNFGVEGGWIWAKGFDASFFNGSITESFDTSANTFYLAGEAAYPFENGFSVFLKGGLSFWDYDISGGEDSDGTDPLFGIGAEYRNTPISPLKFRAEWLRQLQDVDGQDLDADVISLTGGYIF